MGCTGCKFGCYFPGWQLLFWVGALFWVWIVFRVMAYYGLYLMFALGLGFKLSLENVAWLGWVG